MLKSNIRSRKIYLDYASGVVANPSTIHEEGRRAKNELENARSKVAHILHARSSEIIFTSGGTESNNLAIQGIVFAYRNKQRSILPHIITTNIEHPSVLETCNILKQRGLIEISIVAVEPSGLVDPKKIKKEIKKNTILVSVMYANNEIGTIQPIREIAKEIRHYRKMAYPAEFSRVLKGRSNRPLKNSLDTPFFHTDAVQAANYLDLDVEKLGVDLLTLSGSKIEGAGRVGMLYKKKSIPLENIFGGGDQEFGLRPGTENLPAILEFSNALECVQKIKGKEVKRLTKLRDYFIDKLINSTMGAEYRIVLNGDLKNRLPNNVNITIPKIPSDLLVIELSARGIMVSEKSACKAGDGKASHVIQAISKQGLTLSKTLSKSEVNGSLRFSLGRQTTKADLDYTIKTLSKILTKLKMWYD